MRFHKLAGCLAAVAAVVSAAHGSSDTQCSEHKSISMCIAFRHQHNCVWHVPTSECVPDTPCENRTREFCHSEMTTGELATWDHTTNKCFWDAARAECRWSDECIGHATSDECAQARCSWRLICTRADMRRLPGPHRCMEVCTTPGPSSGHGPRNAGTPGRSAAPARAREPTASSSPGRHGPRGSNLTAVIQTTIGPVQGLQEGGVSKFLGIPFAQPPVDQLRWAPPKLMSKWNTTFQATAFGPACSQDNTFYLSRTGVCQGYTRGKCLGYTEDCLSLNIWTPSTTGSRPVMVWIHGGCFESGSASDSEYDGTALASTQDVVVVSIQYRLGPMGFLAGDLLRLRDPTGSTGNYGLMDNVLALQWLQANLARFGGDPSRVTLFGESSGAGSITQLLLVEPAWPYFHQAIMESGAASFWTYMDLAAGYKNFASMATAVNCTGAEAEQVTCLLKQTSVNLANSLASVPCRDGCTWAPVVDGVYVKGRAMTLAAAGQFRPKTPLLSGFNLHDGAMFVSDWWYEMTVMSEEFLQEYFAHRFGPQSAATLSQIFPAPKAVTPSWLSVYAAAANACETQFDYSCTAQWFSTESIATGAPAFIYQFSEPTSNGLTYHGDELGYVFGTLSTPTPAQARVTNLTMSYWGNFAKTGDPNGHGLPTWPTWDSTGALLNITASPVVVRVPHDTLPGCEFFHTNWDFYGSCLPDNPPFPEPEPEPEPEPSPARAPSPAPSSFAV